MKNINIKIKYIICLILLLIIIPKVLSQSQVIFKFSKTGVTASDSRERAVAFQSITYIDSIGHSLGELVLDT